MLKISTIIIKILLTAFNTQELATQNFQLPSPVKPKPKQKKTKAVLVRSPLKLTKSPNKKDGDIRALFSTATKSTKSYTKLINDLGISSNESIPTRLIDLLVDLSLDNTSVEKTCYICQNVCDCKLIDNIRKHRAEPRFSIKFVIDPKLPDIDLIDDINVEYLVENAKNMNSVKYESEIISPCDVSVDNQNNVTVNKLNCSKNFDLEFDFGSPEPNICIQENTPEKRNDGLAQNTNNFALEFDFDSSDNMDAVDHKREKNELVKEEDKNFEIGDIEDIFAESSPEEISAKESTIDKKNECVVKPKETLGFFGLDSIDDIFAEDDDSLENKPSETLKEPAFVNNNNKIVETKLELKEIENYSKKPLEYPTSPSILSGRVKIAPSSPILCTQNKKFQLSTRKPKPSSSTPISNIRRQLIKDPTDMNEPLNKDKSTVRNSINDSKDKSMFTITQLVNMINKTNNESNVNQTSLASSNTGVEVINDEERSSSPILLTQADRKKVKEMSSNSKIAPTPQINKSVSLIILDSDSDASDINDTQIYDINEEEIKKVEKTETSVMNNRNASPLNAKRKLDSDDDSMMPSPYFVKKPKIDQNESKPLTLQEKVLAALTSNKTRDSFVLGNDHIVNYSFSPRKTFSQKENKDPQYLNGESRQNSSDAEKETVRNNKLDMLQMFRRDSKIKSPQEKFKCLLSSNNTHKSQKRKLTFDDSDDDFVDENFTRNQRAVNGYESKPSVDHKARKVSIYYLHFERIYCSLYYY